MSWRKEERERKSLFCQPVTEALSILKNMFTFAGAFDFLFAKWKELSTAACLTMRQPQFSFFATSKCFPTFKKKCERALWQSIVLNLSPSLCIDTQCAHNACCAICAAANTNRTMCLSCLLSLARPVRPVYLLQPSSPVKSERRASANERVTGGRRRRKKIKTRKTRSFPNASRSALSYFTCSPPESPSMYPQAIFFVPVESRFS